MVCVPTTLLSLGGVLLQGPTRLTKASRYCDPICQRCRPYGVESWGPIHPWLVLACSPKVSYLSGICFP